MILYSIMPVDVVFRTYDNEYYKKIIEVDYMGETVQVLPVENNNYMINRLISTSPRAFLNSQLQPGTLIKGNMIKFNDKQTV